MPLMGLDVVVLDELRGGALDADALRTALGERTAARRASRSASAVRRLTRLPRVRLQFCSFAEPSVDDRGSVAMTGALSRLAMLGAVDAEERGGQGVFSLTSVGLSIVNDEEFLGALGSAEDDANALNVPVEVLAAATVLVMAGIMKVAG